jgi:hypothetical protein
VASVCCHAPGTPVNRDAATPGDHRGTYRKGLPVDIQQEEAYAPVVYLKEKIWLLRAEKFCKARST